MRNPSPQPPRREPEPDPERTGHLRGRLPLPTAQFRRRAWLELQRALDPLAPPRPPRLPRH